MEFLIQQLKDQLKSEVKSDHITRLLYSTDASIYAVEPVAVVIPRTKAEMVHALEIASLYHTPIIARGAATGVVGGCLGKGIVIDCSKHLNRIIEINYKERYCVVQPGCVLDHLNDVLAPHGLCIGPDTSTSNRATIGGMVATNAAGIRSLQYGSMVDHVLEVELLFWNGEIARFLPLTSSEWKEKLRLRGQEGKVYRTIERIKREYSRDIKEHFPKIKRRASGYSLDLLMQPDFHNVAKLICGSEGTLGVISEIKIALSPLIQDKQLVAIGCRDFLRALKDAEGFLQFSPFAFEMIDKKIIEAGKKSPLFAHALDWLEPLPEALFLLEMRPELVPELVAFAKANSNTLYTHVLKEQKVAWELRKAGLGLLLSRRSYSQAVGFIEDIAVPIEKIASFIEEIQKILTRFGKEAGIYGHLGAGALHIRPYFDTKNRQELTAMQSVMKETLTLVEQCGGVMSSEHGDGLARSWTTKQVFGERLYQAFSLFKQGFDPYDKMNPGKIVGEELAALTDNLRLSPDTPTKELAPYFDFSREGGFALAVDMCNGNGACRKKEGVMCPSFQVTQDEKDSTRARAHLLQGIIHGKLSDRDILSPEYDAVMDLCIQCKGCKKECPSQVDMAKMKSELLYQRKKSSYRDRLFAHLPWWFRLGAHLPRLTNFVSQSSLGRFLLECIGISRESTLPRLAPKRFSELVRKRNGVTSQKKVVLFVDTFTEFLTPELGLQAVTLLEAIGFSVLIPEWKCCGRTLISKGFLPEAKEMLSSLVDELAPYAEEGIPIVGLEPSCLLTLRDEVRDFHLSQKKWESILKASCLIDEFLCQHLDALEQVLKPYAGEVLIHTHCHQKAVGIPSSQLTLLKRFVTGTLREIPSGCCGMAGSFGYEREHHAFARKIGELILFPEIRASNALIISSGTSCRAHIEASTHKKALHLVELLDSLLGRQA